MHKKYLRANHIIRNYVPRDLMACRQLWVALTQWHRDIYDSPNIGGDNPGLAFDKHLHEVGADNIWVAEVEGEVVGLTGLILEGDEAELEPLVVLDQFRGLGIGRRLAETVIEQARKTGIRQLKVRRPFSFFTQWGSTLSGTSSFFKNSNRKRNKYGKRAKR